MQFLLMERIEHLYLHASSDLYNLCIIPSTDETKLHVLAASLLALSEMQAILQIEYERLLNDQRKIDPVTTSDSPIYEAAQDNVLPSENSDLIVALG